MVKHRSVVVIEDEADIREVMEYNLQREGFRVVCAPDGESGLRRTREESPDLVLLDLMMPGLDGVEVCRLLKENPLTRAIPVIMLTAKGEESDVILGLSIAKHITLAHGGWILVRSAPGEGSTFRVVLPPSFQST
jgi:two-component system phosphate regulon response regulator PhoB